jgi:hypothetical protein
VVCQVGIDLNQERTIGTRRNRTPPRPLEKESAPLAHKPLGKERRLGSSRESDVSAKPRRTPKHAPPTQHSGDEAFAGSEGQCDIPPRDSLS